MISQAFRRFKEGGAGANSGGLRAPERNATPAFLKNGGDLMSGTGDLQENITASIRPSP
jgi:hypothetical protein